MSKVTRDQFEVDGLVVRHIPTAARFSYGSDIIEWGRAGQTLPDGSRYERDDLLVVALEILRQVAAGLA